MNVNFFYFHRTNSFLNLCLRIRHEQFSLELLCTDSIFSGLVRKITPVQCGPSFIWMTSVQQHSGSANTARKAKKILHHMIQQGAVLTIFYWWKLRRVAPIKIFQSCKTLYSVLKMALQSLGAWQAFKLLFLNWTSLIVFCVSRVPESSCLQQQFKLQEFKELIEMICLVRSTISFICSQMLRQGWMDNSRTMAGTHTQ